MSSANGHAKRSEKGLLTQDNCVVALIDHQPQMLFGASYPDRQSIINNTVAFAKATRVFDVPVVLTTVGAYGTGVEYVYTMVHKAPPTVFPEYVVPSAASHR
jgi:nicotinamidase-related amidase